MFCHFAIVQLRKKILEKQKDGTLKVVSNGDSAKAAPKRRGRWDQTEDTGTPVEKKKKADASAWDKEDVSYNYVIVALKFWMSVVHIH